MGTNYYAVETGLKKLRNPKKIHIGKSSGGWCFSLHIHPQDGLGTWSAWKKYLSRTMFVQIEDEYGQVHTLQDLIATVENRSWGARFDEPFPTSATTLYSYSSWTEFFVKNHAEPGPNGLLRHKVDGKYCVKHGKGTYDYLVGEFS